MLDEQMLNQLEEYSSKKLNFWESLSSPKYVVAPMVDLSELAFRMMCRQYNAQLTYTPMLHSGLFATSSKYRELHFQTHPNDHPLFAQFCGNNPQTLLEASLHIEGKVEAIDINLGCPQGIAKRGNYGSFLLQQPDIITSIVSHLTQNLQTPVSCKIRKVSKDLQQTINLCYQLEASGCSAICIHGRTKEEKAQQVDMCDWDAIRIIKERIHIPVIANGGIETFEDVQNCLAYTRADAVMSAEGILDYPALFSGNFTHSRIDLAEEYIGYFKRFPPKSTSCLRAHLFRILHGHLQLHPELRTLLAKVIKVDEFTDIVDQLKIHSKSDTTFSTWYRRHRSISVI